MLEYLTGNASPPSQQLVPPAAIDFPEDWREPIADIARLDGRAALNWFWSRCDHERLNARNDEFSITVRRSLCVPPNPIPTESLSTCL